jgi:photosynthetic reaction center H subunit
METGSITSYIDVAQLVLYAFWIFFAGLIIYLRREDKREGYPLESDRSGQVRVMGFPGMPSPKQFLMRDGSRIQVPREQPPRDIRTTPMGPWLGAPSVPEGDPLADGVGPASYAMRDDHPDLTLEDQPKIVPLRVATEVALYEGDTDPRGFAAVGADGVAAGVVSDIWIDRSDPLVRYFEVTVEGAAAPPPPEPPPVGELDADPSAAPPPAAAPRAQLVLVPYNFAHIDTQARELKVKSVLGSQLAAGPGPANPDQVTLREEDRISAYYAGGLLYATPDRAEPWI